jgi:hypothetical protein
MLVMSMKNSETEPSPHPPIFHPTHHPLNAQKGLPRRGTLGALAEGNRNGHCGQARRPIRDTEERCKHCGQVRQVELPVSSKEADDRGSWTAYLDKCDSCGEEYARGDYCRACRVSEDDYLKKAMMFGGMARIADIKGRMSEASRVSCGGWSAVWKRYR